jgi:hypothetical protein
LNRKESRLITLDLHAASLDAITNGPYTGPVAPRVVDVDLYERIDKEPEPVIPALPAPEPVLEIAEEKKLMLPPPIPESVQEVHALIDEIGDDIKE